MKTKMLEQFSLTDKFKEILEEKHITRMGIEPLCNMLGKSRQAFYHRKYYFSAKENKYIDYERQQSAF